MDEALQKLLRDLESLRKASAADCQNSNQSSWDRGYHRGMETAYLDSIAKLKGLLLTVAAPAG